MKLRPQKKQTKQSSSFESRPPVIFISYTAPDIKVAEMLCRLLRKASCGAIKSFYAFNKNESSGLFGRKVFPEIIKKIKGSSHVICIQTCHSLYKHDWIDFEAGVAAGSEIPVIGIALGVPVSKTIEGPFANFYNNHGDIESITTLVCDLVKMVPGLDPDRKTIKNFARVFINRSAGILLKDASGKGKKENHNSIYNSKPAGNSKTGLKDFSMKSKRPYNKKVGGKKREPGRKRLSDLRRVHREKGKIDHKFLSSFVMLNNHLPGIYKKAGRRIYKAMKSNKPGNNIYPLINALQKVVRQMGDLVTNLEMGNRRMYLQLFKEIDYILYEYIDKLISEKGIDNPEQMRFRL